MDKDTLTILIIAGLTLFVWVPAIVLSIIRAMRKEKKEGDRSRSMALFLVICCHLFPALLRKA